MPIYQYKCVNCGYTWDELVLNISKRKKSLSCPKCKNKKIKKEVTTIAGFNASCSSCSGSCKSCGGGE